MIDGDGDLSDVVCEGVLVDGCCDELDVLVERGWGLLSFGARTVGVSAAYKKEEMCVCS